MCRASQLQALQCCVGLRVPGGSLHQLLQQGLKSWEWVIQACGGLRAAVVRAVTLVLRLPHMPLDKLS
jgi:hypothetical protein